MDEERILQYISPGAWGLVGPRLSSWVKVTGQVGPLLSDRAKKILQTLIGFVEVSPFVTYIMHATITNDGQEDVLPAEKLYHSQISPDPSKRWTSTPAILESLKRRAKQLGLWNLWLSGGEFQGLAGGQGGGLTNLEVRIPATLAIMWKDSQTDLR
jgi:acyl-CoA dehydrogenase